MNTEEWRIRRNVDVMEIRELYQKPKIVDEIKKRRLCRADHVW